MLYIMINSKSLHKISFQLFVTWLSNYRTLIAKVRSLQKIRKKKKNNSKAWNRKVSAFGVFLFFDGERQGDGSKQYLDLTAVNEGGDNQRRLSRRQVECIMILCIQSRFSVSFDALSLPIFPSSLYLSPLPFSILFIWVIPKRIRLSNDGLNNMKIIVICTYFYWKQWKYKL